MTGPHDRLALPARIESGDSADQRCVCLGRSSERRPEWLRFFGSIADELIRHLHPRKVLDAGCATGMLVECLWDRGVEAWGIDSASAAIGEVRQDLRPYCRRASLLEPLVGRFDLVTCVEVLQHVAEPECLEIARNLTRVTDCLLFASSPTPSPAAASSNTRPVLAWLQLFAGLGFHPDVLHDASYVAPYAMLLRRGEPLDEVERVEFAQLLAERSAAERLVDRLEQTAGRLRGLEAALRRSTGWSAAGQAAEPSVQRALAATLDELEEARRDADALWRQWGGELAAALGRSSQQRTRLERRLADLEFERDRAAGEASAAREVADRLTRDGAQRDVERAEAETRVQLALTELRTAEETKRAALLELQRVRDQLRPAGVRPAGGQDAADFGLRLLRHAALQRATAVAEPPPAGPAVVSEGGRGWRLGRPLGRRQPPAAEPEIAAPSQTPEQRIALLVDEEYYFRRAPEARASGLSAAEHYLQIGADLRLNPNPLFDTEFYLMRHPDVAAAGTNPLLHYVDFGAREGRPTHPSLEAMQRVAAGSPAVATDARPGASPGAAPSVQRATTPELPDRFALRRHDRPVTVIVAVHDALDDVRRCLSAVIRWTLPPYELVLVDDGSAAETGQYLRRFAAEQGARLLANSQAKGYTVAANQGLRAARGDYVVLLNSDTTVAEHWLDRLVMCAESDPQIGLVGPLSNTASWQSVPAVEEHGDWASNPLPAGWSVDDMAREIAARTGRVYPRLPFLNGFCLMIKRAVIEALGSFDEESFGEGYGEENDYCLRARAAGWALAVADDTYVHHAQSKSYSPERRKRLYVHADQALRAKHAPALIEEGVRQCRDDLALLGIRARARQLGTRRALIEEARAQWEGRRVAFVLPICEVGGGGNVVLAEARAMQRFGVDAVIVNLAAQRSQFESSYPEPGVRVIYAASAGQIPDLVADYDAVVGTANHSLFWIAPLAERSAPPRLGYYIQDFEPYFFAPGTAEHELALSSYAVVERVLRFTKTEWNRDELLRRVGLDSTVVGPSCDIDRFQPRPEPSGGRCRVGAMIRPSSPRRSARATMEILAEADRRYGRRIEIHLFGVEPDDPMFLVLPRDFRWQLHGVLTPERTAALLGGLDVFVDFSRYQAMGLTAMEAMASGLGVVVPKAGGASSFARDGENALVVDTADPPACLAALASLVEDSALLGRLRSRAAEDLVEHFPERAAAKVLSVLFADLAVPACTR